MTVALPEIKCRFTTDNPQNNALTNLSPWNSVPPAFLVPVETGQVCVDYYATSVRTLWTAERLHIAFECEDQSIWGTRFERDSLVWEEEAVEVFISPGESVRQYFEFQVSPHNTVFDAKVSNPHSHRDTMLVVPSWDCEGLISAAASSTPISKSKPEPLPKNSNAPLHVWSVEISIPFASLGVSPPNVGDIWRINFFRIDRTEPTQFLAWSPTLISPADFHVPERFGKLEFV